MHKFRFRLESVLHYRREVESQAKEGYLMARARRLEQEIALDRIVREREERLRTAMQTVNERMAMDAYVMRLQLEFEQGEIIRNVLATEEDQAREAWEEARRELESLEKLKEKRFQEWLLEVRREEQRNLDEWATMRRAA